MTAFLMYEGRQYYIGLEFPWHHVYILTPVDSHQYLMDTALFTFDGKKIFRKCNGYFEPKLNGLEHEILKKERPDLLPQSEQVLWHNYTAEEIAEWEQKVKHFHEKTITAENEAKWNDLLNFPNEFSENFQPIAEKIWKKWDKAAQRFGGTHHLTQEEFDHLLKFGNPALKKGVENNVTE